MTVSLMYNFRSSSTEIEKCDRESNHKMSHFRNTLNFIYNFRENSTQAFVEGDLGVYGIAVLSFFSNGI